MNTLTWLGIAFCVTQSAMFSGLNLALFGVSRLRLEVERSKNAQTVLELRRDSNFLLTTILWGNVAVNCLLTILSNSVLTGLMAFLFSTVVITFFGEIAPQAYFSRNALRMAALLAPVLKAYQKILYPVAKPTAMALNAWLGREGIQYFRERDMRAIIRKHMAAAEADIDRVEGRGALNFLALDDLPVARLGEPVDPKSVIELPLGEGQLPVFPTFERSADDPFLRRIEESGRKWVILTGPHGHARLVLDTDGFLRNALFTNAPLDPYAHCHRPLAVTDGGLAVGRVLWQLKVRPERTGDHVIDQDLILVWGEEKRVITGADLLGWLLRGISTRVTDDDWSAV